MPLFESISAAVSKLFTQQVQQQNAAVTTGVVDTTQINTTLRDWADSFALPIDRRSRYDDFDQMDTGDTAITLDEIVEQATTFEDVQETPEDPLLEAHCFKIDLKVGKRNRAREVITDLLTDTQIRDELPAIMRDMVKYGDEFVELIWEDDEIKGIQPHGVREMHVGRDNHGRLLTGKDDNGFSRAFQQRNVGGKAVQGWEPYEMLHFKLYPTKKSAYSRISYLDNIRYDWKKLNWLEQGMVVARTTRAYPRLMWQRDMTGKVAKDAETAMQKFIMAITRKHTGSGAQQKAPMQPDEDIFVTSAYTKGDDGKLYPKLDKVEMLDPQTQGLGVITDVNYMRRKIFNRVPADTVGIHDNTQGDMTTQDLSLSRFVNHVQRQAEVILRVAIDRALVAQGLTAEYRFIWPRPQVRNDWKWASSFFQKSMGLQNHQAMGIISREYIRMTEFGMTREESDQVEEVIKKEREALAAIQATNTGQGDGDGSGKTGDIPNSNDTANKRTAGHNSGPKDKEDLQRHHAEQLKAVESLDV